MEGNRLKNFAVFTGIGIQMGATIYIGHLFGSWLDTKNHQPEPYYATWVTLAAVVLATVSVIVQVIRFSNKKDN